MENIHNALEKLATFSSCPSDIGVTRILYTKEDLAARAYFLELSRDLGLEVKVDAIGNTFARWKGQQPDLAAIGTGSHIDAIPHSGKYDGTVGVFGGLAAIDQLQQEGFQPKRSIEVLMFTAEEPTRFGIGCLGSRVLSGQLSPASARTLSDPQGQYLNEVRKAAGFTGALDSVLLPDNYYHAFIELHIEQGPILEKEELDIGIVSKIAAPSTLKVKLKGEGGHAGCVLMPDRKDAGCAAAEIALAVEQIARSSASPDTVATTGILEIQPAAVNSIPKAAYMEIDLRDTQIETRDKALTSLQDQIRYITGKRNVEHSMELLNCDPPAICDSNLVETIQNICENLNYSSKVMISRAYHDSLFMAQRFPTTMIFIPSKDGISHRPDEYSSPRQIDKGVRVLAQTLKTLSSSFNL